MGICCMGICCIGICEQNLIRAVARQRNTTELADSLHQAVRDWKTISPAVAAETLGLVELAVAAAAGQRDLLSGQLQD